jgi:predicted Fe-Mo cluster-binding NifX family protein
MKIAISATGTNLDAEVDPRFGRCQYFVLADVETNDFEGVENTSAAAAGGAGIATAQMIVGKNVEAVLTGNCGPNAHEVLSSAGIKIVTGVSGKIKDVIEEYKLGTYSAAQQPNVADHYGMNAGAGGGGGMGGGRGMGGGKGMGRGSGRGMGRGMGMGGGVTPTSSAVPPSSSPKQEIEILKDQSQALASQLEEIKKRIEELGKNK